MISSSQDHLRRHSSVSDVPVDNVLRKVASLTLDKNTIEQKVHKPKFVPEKLDFQLYEKFEGEYQKGFLEGQGIYFFRDEQLR